MFYVTSTAEIKVVYKDGRQDFIDYEQGIFKKIISPQGREIEFSYSSYNQQEVLWKITDNVGRELTIDWWSNSAKTIVTHKVNNAIYQSLEFAKANNGIYQRLISVKLPDNTSIFHLEYEYAASNGYDLIKRITHPGGKDESITYLNNGHSLPDGAPFAHAPYVTEHKVICGDNQPNQITTYSYSDKNYLGFASEQAFVPGEDILLQARADYEYSSVETINNSHSTTRYYNKYHLQTVAEYRRNDTLYKREDNIYFADTKVSVEHQPANYTYLQKMHVTHYDGTNTRLYVFQYDYDDYGNQTYRREANGDAVKRTFYPAGGEGDHCPAEPNGFVSLLKKETALPSVTINNESARTTTITYQSLPSIGGGYFILLKKIENPLERSDYTYYNDLKSLKHQRFPLLVLRDWH